MYCRGVYTERERKGNKKEMKPSISLLGMIISSDPDLNPTADLPRLLPIAPD